MKKYVFIVPAIGNMGGSQMYLANKCEYLEEQGWRPEVFYCYPFVEFHIDYLKQFIDNRIPELLYTIDIVPLNRKRAVIDRIVEKIKDAEEIIIESHMVYLAFWAEEIAKEVNGKHVSNFMEEKYPELSKEEAAFFIFKLRRGEMLNSGNIVLRKLLGNYYSDDLKGFEHVGHFPCSNVVSDKVSLNVEVASADYSIVSVGRLDKPYIPTLCKELEIFFKRYSNNKFNLFIVGGSAKHNLESIIEERFSKMENVNLHLLGYMLPIPSSLLEISDMAISSSNSVLVTADHGIPTICVDTHDYGAIGVYGYTTKNMVFRGSEPFIPISSLIEEILIKKKYTKTWKNGSYVLNGCNEIFAENLLYVKQSDPRKIYYDISSIHSWVYKLLHRIKWRARSLVKRGA